METGTENQVERILIGTKRVFPEKKDEELRIFAVILKFDHENGIFTGKDFGEFKYEIRNKRMQFLFRKYSYSAWNGTGWNHIFQDTIQMPSGAVHKLGW